MWIVPCKRSIPVDNVIADAADLASIWNTIEPLLIEGGCQIVKKELDEDEFDEIRELSYWKRYNNADHA